MNLEKEIDENHRLMVHLALRQDENDLNRLLFQRLIMMNIMFMTLITQNNKKKSTGYQFESYTIKCPYCEFTSISVGDYIEHMSNEWLNHSNNPLNVISRVYNNTNIKKDTY